MKLFRTLIFLSTLLLLNACHNYQEPSITEGIIPFGKNDMENDISRTKAEIPKNIRKITQYSNDTILNVIEYDKNGNEVFKYYKQYVGELWNGKYITMISANLYEGDELKKTYYFHSNVGFSLITYKYGVFDREIGVKEITNNISPANSNPFRMIDTIRSFAEILKCKMTDSLNKLKTINYTVTRKYPFFQSKIEEQYNFKNRVYLYFGKNGQLIRQEWASGNVDCFYYNKNCLLTKYYQIGEKKDTQSVKRIHYNKDCKIDTMIVDGWKYVYEYNKDKKVVELEFNGEAYISKTITSYNSLGYPTAMVKVDSYDSLPKIRKFEYRYEYYEN
jgi:hypothetical protein